MLKVVVVEPGAKPCVKVIEDKLEAMQEVVGGYIEMIALPYDFERDIVLICNEEGKLLGLPGNRRVGDDIIAGTFFVAALNDEDGSLVSLTDAEINKISELFSEIEEFSPEQVQDSIKFNFRYFE